MTVNAPRRVRHREPDPKYMTFVEHLAELRRRLVISVLAIAVGSVVGWILAGRAIHLIDQPLCNALHHKHCQLVVNQVYGGFTLQLKIAIIIGFAIALPVTIWQLWGFVAPAFGPAANWWGPLWMVSALVLFAAGVVTGYFVVPLALNFFSTFQSTNVQILPFANEYVSFIVLILAVFGVSFELPLVLVSLTGAGITSSRWLAAKRVYFFFGIFAAATIVTPGADWISPLVLGGILYVLYEVSIIVSRLLGK
jgi:sec-independent protein translocase protein TatC